MINHFRTLLGNVAMLADDAIGTEYIPRDFSPRRLPKQLQRIHGVLFGTSPDRAFLNQRLFQYMKVMHSTELEEFVREIDPRITYLPLDEGWFDSRCKVRITKLGTDCRAYLLGQLAADNPLGRAVFGWRAEVTDATTITLRRRVNGFTESTITADVSRSLSQVIPLPGSDLSLRIGTRVGDESDLSSIVGARVMIDGVARVSADLTTVVRELDALFFGQVGGYLFAGDEPFKTFRNLWYKHPHLPYRLGGALAAYVYRLHETSNV